MVLTRPQRLHTRDFVYVSVWPKGHGFALLCACTYYRLIMHITVRVCERVCLRVCCVCVCYVHDIQPDVKMCVTPPSLSLSLSISLSLSLSLSACVRPPSLSLPSLSLSLSLSLSHTHTHTHTHVCAHAINAHTSTPHSLVMYIAQT